MARSIVLISLFWLGFALLHAYGWALFGLDEKYAWAMLLPGFYFVGLTILRD